VDNANKRWFSKVVRCAVLHPGLLERAKSSHPEVTMTSAVMTDWEVPATVKCTFTNVRMAF
jgi:hypothetical protein